MEMAVPTLANMRPELKFVVIILFKAHKSVMMEI